MLCLNDFTFGQHGCPKLKTWVWLVHISAEAQVSNEVEKAEKFSFGEAVVRIGGM